MLFRRLQDIPGGRHGDRKQARRLRLLVGLLISLLTALLLATTVVPLVQARDAGQLAIAAEATQTAQAPEATPATSPDSLNNSPGQSSSEIPNEAMVELAGQPLFQLQKPVGSISAAERAEIISRRILKLAEDSSFSLENLTVKPDPGDKQVVSIMAGEQILLQVTPADAKAAEIPAPELAKKHVATIQQAVTQFRIENHPRSIILNLIYMVLATILLILSLRLVNWLFIKLINGIRSPRLAPLMTIRLNQMNLVSPQEARKVVLGLTKLIRVLIILTLLYVYLVTILRLFFWTRAIANSLLDYVVNPLEDAWQGFINYLPNFFTILVIVFFAFYLIKFLRYLFNEIGSGTITIPGFYPEWAQPTQRLVLFLVIALVLVTISQYLPVTRSPAAQGISLFFGLLLTLGGASSVANIVSGIILIYTRAFRVGDFVRIGDINGKVIEKSILVTRICTPRNVVVTIPNSVVANSHINNFTIAGRELESPLILHTTITLGYDIPWRKVHDALIKAALRTTHILPEPEPFVWQSSLNDFHISYEINAYTDQPLIMLKIYSELHQNIQDCCNEAGIEILSPQYTALRDGNQTTIPEDYVPQNYSVPGFRLFPFQQPPNQNPKA